MRNRVRGAYLLSREGKRRLAAGPAAGGRNRYRTDVAGRVRLAQPGRYRVAVKPGGNWKGLALQAITLRPESSPGPRRPGGAVGR